METALSTAKVAMLREGDLAHYRTPPHNNEAEQALLGAILVNNNAYHRVSEFLLPEHFADAVLNDHPLAYTPQNSLGNMQVIDALKESARTGRKVVVGSQ